MKTNEIVAGGKYTPKMIIPSGSLMLDRVLNKGGYPTGSMIHYYSGQEGAFKTALSLMGLMNMQAEGERVGFVDAENSLDVEWAQNIGIDINEDRWVYSMPTSGEIALEHVEQMIIEHECKAIVLDSIDACQPAKYQESEYGESSMMIHAKLINKFARRIIGLCKDHDAIVFVINQMRTAGGSGMTYNKPSGGKGLPFYSTINIEMRRSKSPSNLIGVRNIPLTINIKRSKLGRSFLEVETFGTQGRAIDNELELVTLAQEKNIITRAGSWFKAGDETIGQTLESAKEWALQHQPKIMEE